MNINHVNSRESLAKIELHSIPDSVTAPIDHFREFKLINYSDLKVDLDESS